MDRIDILWTGGFDSTYRICQLSLMPVEVQPYYISAGKRSEPQELKAMADIVDYINGFESKKCKLLPLIVVKLSDIEPDQQIMDSFNIIRKEIAIGTQYEWLARFARQWGIRPELGFEKNESGPIPRYFCKHGALREVSKPLTGGEGNLEYREFDGSQTSEDLFNIFGQLRFGLPLNNMTKLQTKEAYREIGYESVIPMTWFCAFPLNGKPCGLCHPCEFVMKKGMGFRMPFRARMLYGMLKANRLGRYVDIKVKAIYNNHWRK